MSIAPSQAASAVVIPPNATRQTVLAMLGSGSIDAETASKWLDKHEPQKRVAGALYCKVSIKGAISVYGLNSQFPITLYAGQWERFLEDCPTHFVLMFIRENEGRTFEVAEKDAKGKATGKTVQVQINRK